MPAHTPKPMVEYPAVPRVVQMDALQRDEKASELPLPSPPPVLQVLAQNAPDGSSASQGGTYRELGYRMAVARGWADYWPTIDALIESESSWSVSAQNPVSTACGIAQNINGCGAYPDPSPAGQIQWAYDYIAQRYGTPAGAWAHKCATTQDGKCADGWY